METSVVTCKNLIKESITDFLLDHPYLKFRYGYSIDEELHLIEVSPSSFSSESFMDDFDLCLSKAVSKIDMHQSLVIFPANDVDFHLENCDFELEGLLYSEWNMRGSVVQVIFKGRKERTEIIPEDISPCDYDYSAAA